MPAGHAKQSDGYRKIRVPDAFPQGEQPRGGLRNDSRITNKRTVPRRRRPVCFTDKLKRLNFFIFLEKSARGLSGFFVNVSLAFFHLNLKLGKLLRIMSGFEMADYVKIEARQSPVMHSQVMRIREEEQSLGNNIFERKITPSDRAAILHLTAQMKDVLVSNSRRAFPSPLGMKGSSRPLVVNR
ncbi:hypothetical protein SUGI_1101260 [Cryptomeria japonica]|nr:hypothetical protein SUGI_1101260 [Cryptomeria japonica]